MKKFPEPSRDAAIRMMRLSLAWSLAMALVHVLLGRWANAVVMVFCGAFTWHIVRWVLRIQDLANQKPLGPRLLRRRDGRICRARKSDRAWHEPALTYCEEMEGRPREAPGETITCMACIANNA